MNETIEPNLTNAKQSLALHKYGMILWIFLCVFTSLGETFIPRLTSTQSFLQQEIKEPHESQTIDTALVKTKNSLVQKGKLRLIADGTGHPEPPEV
ncbi:hypothetical protein H1Q63_35355 [Desmonostoc muscorum CCALA 125]|nr:hypothetical protein [Desmonostoc muscorum CCALA 125]